MGDMADFALDGLFDEDAAQLDTLGRSNVFRFPPTHCHCGAALIVKYGKFGAFLACPRWPECRGRTHTLENSLNDEDLFKMGDL